MRAWRFIPLIVTIVTCGSVHATDGPFLKGPSQSPESFPLAVWLQSPTNADRYQALGINTYVGLWRGPTEEQLDALDRAGIRLICGQNDRSLRFKDRPTIVGWMHGDEPDNAQSLGRGKGYGPPIPPATILEGYQKIRKADPDRPVLLNLGQGVAWDGWFGRGVRTNHPEDYREYLKGGDIVSFDIYPASHDKPEIAGNLWYVPLGVDRLKRWSEGRKGVWCCIETTRINNVNRKPTPMQVRSEVWMALIHGAKGIIYFAHEFKPKFIEAGLLADEDMAHGVAALNRRILDLAPALNGPDIAEGAVVTSAKAGVPVDFVVKRHAGDTYLFSVAMREGETTASFTLPGKPDSRVEVLGEGRIIDAVGGTWEDHFNDYEVHLYKISPEFEEVTRTVTTDAMEATMSTKPTRQQAQACDQLAEALVLITQAARLDGSGKLDREDLDVIANRLAQATPVFGLEGIVAGAIERRGRSLGLPSGLVELLTILDPDVRPLDLLLLTDDGFRELVNRLNEELGDV